MHGVLGIEVERLARGESEQKSGKRRDQAVEYYRKNPSVEIVESQSLNNPWV